MRTDPSSISSSVTVLHFLEGRVDGRRSDRVFRCEATALDFPVQEGLPGVDSDSDEGEYKPEAGSVTRPWGDGLSSSGTTTGSGTENKLDVEGWSSEPNILQNS